MSFAREDADVLAILLVTMLSVGITLRVASLSVGTSKDVDILFSVAKLRTLVHMFWSKDGY